ncbi:MAG: hypothetical protein AAGJ92_08140, partial [Pseudomonadota bacterium]
MINYGIQAAFEFNRGDPEREAAFAAGSALGQQTIARLLPAPDPGDTSPRAIGSNLARNILSHVCDSAARAGAVTGAQLGSSNEAEAANFLSSFAVRLAVRGPDRVIAPLIHDLAKAARVTGGGTFANIDAANGWSLRRATHVPGDAVGSAVETATGRKAPNIQEAMEHLAEGMAEYGSRMLNRGAIAATTQFQTEERATTSRPGAAVQPEAGDVELGPLRRTDRQDYRDLLLGQSETRGPLRVDSVSRLDEMALEEVEEQK